MFKNGSKWRLLQISTNLKSLSIADPHYHMKTPSQRREIIPDRKMDLYKGMWDSKNGNNIGYHTTMTCYQLLFKRQSNIKFNNVP